MVLPQVERYVLALVFYTVFVGAFGMVSELCLSRTYGKDPLYGLLFTFGAALVIEESIRVIWGTRDYVLPLPDAISGATLVGGMIYAKYRFFAAAFAVVMIGLLWVYIERTPYGAIIKAG